MADSSSPPSGANDTCESECGGGEGRTFERKNPLGEEQHAIQREEEPQQPQCQWPTDFGSYELVRKIGQGAFAAVWRARVKDTDECCAIKILDLEQIDTNLVDIRLEVQTMRLSSHPNVLTCYTSFVKDMELWLVTQLMDKGSSLYCIHAFKAATLVAGALHDVQEEPVSPIENHVTFILHETLLGLRYIHDNGQIHRDIKAGNILLDSAGNVRIADFGVSGWLVNAGNRRENTKTFVGTPCWMAPEVMEQVHGYDYKADIWSVGITALELAKGYAPYAKYAPMKVLLMTIQEPPPSFDTYDDDDDDDNVKWSKSFKDMIKICLQKDPKKRPTCQQLLNHKHFKNFANPTYREERQLQLKSQVCDIVQDVGLHPGGNQQQFPGNAPVYIVQSTAPNRPAGTSWVFSDGSQVLASTSKESGNDDTDDKDDFFDEFERTTRGENFSSLTAEQHELEKQRLEQLETDTEKARRKEREEMEDFFDEFEKTTGGENFKKNAEDTQKS